MISRRTMLAAPLALAAQRTIQAQSGLMTIAIHQNTSLAAGYRRSLEGWARAGVRHAELVAEHVEEFLKTDSLAAARRVLTDNGLTAVAAATRVNGLWEPNPGLAGALDTLKRRCEMFAGLGLTKVYSPTGTMGTYTQDDYKVSVSNMRAAGDVARQFGQVMMVEAVRGSTFISTLPTLLRLTREAAHPNLAPLLDCYHFWSGLSKLEDLDLIRQGELGHVHYQDVPDIPREMMDNTTRIIPGDGVSPLNTILRKLAEKGYRGSLSVELFLPRYRDGDPFEVAREIKQKGEAVMRAAGVL